MLTHQRPAQYTRPYRGIREGVYLGVWWWCTWCVYTCDSVCVKVDWLSLPTAPVQSGNAETDARFIFGSVTVCQWPQMHRKGRLWVTNRPWFVPSSFTSRLVLLLSLSSSHTLTILSNMVLSLSLLCNGLLWSNVTELISVWHETLLFSCTESLT